ncbi:MAG: glycosyltransferase family 2 protein [Alphaproteobacteria bacterium]|nr:glycosyltransferase family 2 protein [Alphaproteobacteria bacterium]
MKLIIQIPCYNEEGTLPVTLKALPREVAGFDHVEWLVVDDGSTDRTAEMARQHGVDHVVTHPHNKGLAQAFMSGIEACLTLGADVIVNTDADNQYDAADIPALVAPILNGQAQIVVGARPIDEIEHFSIYKKMLQRLGSWVVSLASGVRIPDAPCGYRAIDRNAAMQLYVYTDYTYTLETIIQAGRRNIVITSVPVRVNAVLRPSRLMRSTASYVWRSMITIIRVFMLYMPMAFLGLLSVISGLAGFALGVRYLVFMAMGEGQGHLQSVILAAVLLLAGLVFLMGALISDMLVSNRRLMEEVRMRLLADRVDGKTSGDDGEPTL